MAKTAKEIVGDIIAMVRSHSIAHTVNGEVYRKGYRPRDSRKEDIVVILTTGIPNQIEEGVVTIHAYVPDIEFNGVMVEDGARCDIIERTMTEFVESLNTNGSCYKFNLQATVSTEEAPEIEQHFVVAMLHYKYFGG